PCPRSSPVKRAATPARAATSPWPARHPSRTSSSRSCRRWASTSPPSATARAPSRDCSRNEPSAGRGDPVLGLHLGEAAKVVLERGGRVCVAILDGGDTPARRVLVVDDPVFRVAIRDRQEVADVVDASRL